jgi:hypothetical protein
MLSDHCPDQPECCDYNEYITDPTLRNRCDFSLLEVSAPLANYHHNLHAI